jgi:hypothetical protein
MRPVQTDPLDFGVLTPGGRPTQNDPQTGSRTFDMSFWQRLFDVMKYWAIPLAGGAASGAFGGPAIWGGADAASAGLDTAAGGAGATGSTVPVTGALAPGLAPSGAVSAAATGGAALDPALQAAGWTTARVAKLALSLGVPVASLITKLNSVGGSNGIPGPFGSQINDTLQLMNDRLRSTVPVHDAAMQLAMKMGAPSNPDPALLSSASNAVRSPAPTMQPSPEVAAAAAALAKHFGGG